MKNSCDGKKHVGYATVTLDEGINYREIAEAMTHNGFKMNHSSARNYVLRVMKKFVVAITSQWDIIVPEHKMNQIAKSPQFQQVVCSLLQSPIGVGGRRRKVVVK